jgi:RHS repeat-associated protein
VGVSSYNYNPSNQLTSTSAASFTYDANGNTLSKSIASGTTTYGWDFENRLTQAVVPAVGTTTFKYDPFGRRIQKSGPNGTTNYLYDGDAIIAEVDASGNQLARYAQGPYVDEPMAMMRSGAASFYQQDGIGTVTSLSSLTGTLSNSYTYDAFGNLVATTGVLANPFQFTGRDFDPETGLRYYRARYYDPAIGRFISEDPIGFAGGINKYAYVDNDPVDYTDPLGLSRDCGKPKCFAQLKYRQVDNKWARRFHRNHAFWYVQGSDGKQFIISAGPNPPDGGNQMLNIWPPNPNTQTGVDSVSAGTSWNSGLSEANCPGVDAMIAAAVAWPQDTIPYHPVGGPNSDTAAHYLGTQGGFNPPAPPGMTGWNTPLPPLGHH